MIILGSHEAAIDLLEKRSANYSSRPHNPMVDMYVPCSLLGCLWANPERCRPSSAGVSWALTLQPYGTWWRRHRKAMHQYFNPNAIKRYERSLELEAHRLTRRLLEHPADFLHHIRQYVSPYQDIHDPFYAYSLMYF